MLDILQEMNRIKSEQKNDTGKPSTTVLKLTPEESCYLTDEEKRKLEKQLREAGGPDKIPVQEFRLSMNTVGKIVASYFPGTSDLASLPSSAPLTATIANV